MPTLSGTVKDSTGAFAEKLVRVYRRGSGAFVGQVLSNATTGAWSITTANTDEHFAIVHDMTGNPLWDKVVLAMRMDSTGLTDDKGNTITLGGNLARSATYSRYGGYSAYSDGSGDYCYTPYSQANFDWWTSGGKYTIDLSVRPVSLTNASSAGNPVLIGNAAHNSTTNYWSFGPRTDGSVAFFYYNGASNTVATPASLVTTGSFFDLSLEINGTEILIYVNGNPRAGGAISGTPQSSSGTNLTMLQVNNVCFNAYLDEVIITRDVVHKGQYTVPSSPTLGSFTDGTGNALIFDHLIPV